MDRYIDLINQTFDFPTEEFRVDQDQLFFNEINLMPVIEKYGTPLKLYYLPKIDEKIQHIRRLFQESFERHQYPGHYTYCYCTKSSHFRFILEKVLANDVHIETSSAYDIPIIQQLHKEGQLSKNTYILCNGFKRERYLQYITELIQQGFTHCIPILDNKEELQYYKQQLDQSFAIGLRVAADEEPDFEFYTSRLGIRYDKLLDFYKTHIADDPQFQLKMLHYFVNSGIQDTAYYWNELRRFVRKYCELKQVCPELDSIDIGGGLPIKTSIYFDYDYAYMIDQVVYNILDICREYGVEPPHIFTEFGSFTVGESGANIYSVLGQKQQNDKELWYMIDSSFITNLPDSWGINQRFILLAINQWKQPYQKVNLGGLTCDSMDYYNSEAHTYNIYMPQPEASNPLYIGLFHTGAYQETLGGFGGLQHCLIPSSRMVVIQENQNGELEDKLFFKEQEPDSMMKILGY